MSRRLHVLMPTPRMVPFVGGVETHVREVAARLAAWDIAVTVVACDVSGELPPREQIDGFELRRVPAYPRDSDYMFAPELAQTILRGRWDLVHVQSYHTLVAPLAMAAALRRGTPYVLTFHAGGHSSPLRTLVRTPQVLMLRPLLRRAAALVSIADWEVAHYGRLLGLPPSRFVSIPNGADLAAPSDPGPPPDGPLIVSSGRLERYKGHHRVINALPYVLRDVPDARLWIAGRGPYEEELREQIRRLHLEDRVEIRALSDRAELAGRLGQASVGVMLSDFETQPIAALEALSLGVPMVVANNSGLAEIASRGWAVPVELDASPEAHGAAIARQILDPLPRPDVELPTWEACTEGLARLYRQLVPR